jgi:indole-3-glycerol phosphate synthase
MLISHSDVSGHHKVKRQRHFGFGGMLISHSDVSGHHKVEALRAAEGA